jgi:hypothetical protein
MPGSFLEPEGALELMLCEETGRVISIVTVRVNACGKALTVEVSHDAVQKIVITMAG